MSVKPILLCIEDPVLGGVVSEAFGAEAVVATPAEANFAMAKVVVWEGYRDARSPSDTHEMAPVLLLGDQAPDWVTTHATERQAIPVRLGKVLDQSRYLLSKRGRGVTIDEHFTFGPYVFEDGGLRDAAGALIRLTDKEKSILALLHKSPQQKIDRKTLLDKVWGYAETAETHTLETHIYRLRQKIETDPANPIWLVTDGNHYKLNSEAV